MSLFRRRKTRWQRFTERMAGIGAGRRHLSKRALGLAGGAAGLVAASAAASSLRDGDRDSG